MLLAALGGPARSALAFETISRVPPGRSSHLAAYACAVAGAGLIAASFPLTDRADRRYSQYEHETDPALIESRWDRTVWADREAGGALLTGEALLVAAAYLRFLHHPSSERVSLLMGPSACAVRWSF
jgi:hypothetical protein